MSARPELAGISITSGATGDGRGFCRVNVELTDGAGYQGQLSPSEVRTMALDWLGAAEAAETDGALIVFAQEELDLKPDVAGKLLLAFRHLREDQHARYLAEELKRSAR